MDHSKVAIKAKLPLVWLIALVCACGDSKHVDPAYQNDFDQWKGRRIQSLKDNWLPLAGLYWLEPGLNSFGSDSLNELVFPPTFHPRFGVFRLDTAGVHYARYSQNDTLLTYRPVDLQMDEPEVFSSNSFRWWIIERSGKFAVRLKDTLSSNLAAFKEPTGFELDEEWRLPATFTPYSPPKPLIIADILGMERTQEAPGFVSFQIDGQTYQLDVLPKGFVIFGDETNGLTTYGAGRYVYIDPPPQSRPNSIGFQQKL